MKRIIIMMMMLMVIAACDTPEAVEEVPTSCPPDCAGGSQGIETTVYSPTEEGNIYTSEMFAPVFEIVDKGESDAYGTILITGLDSDVFSSYTGCYPLDFDVFVNDPDEQFFERAVFDSLPQASITSENSLEQTMTVYTRYAYTTFGTYEVCLTGDPVGEKECSISGNKLLKSSSGPVEVTSVEEELTKVGSNAVTLRLTVEGKVNAKNNEKLLSVEDATNTDCLLTQAQYTEVEVDAILFGQRHDCGKMMFEKGEDEATVTCKIENLDTSMFIGGQKEYTGWVELDYGFQNIQSVSFNVIADN